MPQTVGCDLFLYADDTCSLLHLVIFTKNFSRICDWVVNNKLSIHFREDKTKPILFSTKNRKIKIGTLDILFGDVKIKQYSKATF